ncbi:MAG: NAD(P)-dependent oxidoreductase [Chloroflexi bacterium]|nr:NAD(P)-dependent oxidoreductase [Chloroflexota bacterium]MDA1297700.1 NAD(P)-dependent oxidoreductase [Chloroflexota bacterium]
MNILVTGITGRVGANVARHFLQNGHSVRGFVWPGDRQSAKLAQVGAEIVEGDLASAADVKAAADGQEVILHLGAAFQAGGPFTPQQYFDTNVKGTFNVLEAALGLGEKLKHVIVTSTDATMAKYPPEGIADPIREDSLPLSSTDWYGYTKVLDEHLVDRYVRHERLRATVIRFANVWGAGELLDFRQFHLKTFIDQFKSRTDAEGKRAYEEMSAAYQGEPHLIVACDSNGRPWKKQMVEVREIVHAYDLAIGNPNTFGKVYQLASREPFTWDVIVPYIANAIGAPYTRVSLPVNPTFYEYDLSAAMTDFGYNPRLTAQDMVDEAVRFRASGGGDIIPTRL